MYTMIIFTVIGFLLGLYIFIINKEYFLAITMAFFFGFIFMFSSIFIEHIIGVNKPDDEKTTYIVKQYDIVSLKYGNSFSGRFFIGSGNINNKIFYYAFIKKSDGIINKTFDSSKCIIKYTKGKPHIEEIHLYYKTKWIFSSEKKYIMYIPKNSINANFMDK